MAFLTLSLKFNSLFDILPVGFKEPTSEFCPLQRARNLQVLRKKTTTMKMGGQTPLLRTLTKATLCLKKKEKSGKQCPQRVNTEDHQKEGHIVAGQWVVIPQVGRQANRRPTKSSVMRVQRKFVEEVSGDEEGVVEEVNKEGAKKKELQVNICFSCLYAVRWRKIPTKALIGTIGLRCCCSIDHYKYFVCRI